jgi:hypothetical protein
MFGREDVQLAEADKQRLRTLSIGCGALMASCVLLAGVGYVLSTVLTGPVSVDPLVTNVLLGLGAAELVGSSLMRSMLLRAASAANPVARWFTANIVAMAMRQGAAVMGLVVTILTHEPVWAAALAGVALMGMATSFPTTERYLDWRRGA